LTGERGRRRRVGRVGRPHGHAGAFYVEDADQLPEPGSPLRVQGRDRTLLRRAGMPRRPLVKLEGIADREAALALKGQILMASVADAPLEDGEWLAEDLVGCEIAGLGPVRRIIRAPSCDLLEAGPDEVLVPFIRDAILRIDVAGRSIEVDRRFLGLNPVPSADETGARDRPTSDAAGGDADRAEAVGADTGLRGT
jgi:16S rRNA processing protein RimM